MNTRFVTAPFDAITVAAGGPGIPPALLEQLRVGGRLIIPVGQDQENQRLVRAVRRGEKEYDYEELGGVRFVPLIGEAGWQEDAAVERPLPPARPKVKPGLPELIRQAAEPIESPDRPRLDRLLFPLHRRHSSGNSSPGRTPGTTKPSAGRR